jgi:drug/metabolite transporter (DMT)-like permease
MLGADETGGGADGRAYLLLTIVVLSLGINWPILAMGLGYVSPAWMTVFRLASATLVVSLFNAVAGRLRLPARGDLPMVLSVGLVRLAFVYYIVLVALQFVPPGRSSVLVWTSSLWTVPMAWIFLRERMTWLRWVGLAVGIGGIVVLVGPARLVGPDSLLGHTLLLVAAVANAAVAVHIRAHRWHGSPLDLLPWQLWVALAPVAAGTLLLEGPPASSWDPTFGLIVAYQGIFATALALWAQVSVLRRLPAVSTNLSLMAVPVVGLLSSAVIAGEEITAGVLTAMTLIGTGVGLNLLADARERATARTQPILPD